MSKQTYFPGTEPQGHNPDIEKAIDAWMEAKDEQKYAAEKTKLRHAALLLQMSNVGCEVYPFVDPKTGKRKSIMIAREPKAKTARAPKWNRNDGDAEIGDEVTILDDEDAVDNKVEKRRVKRSSVEKEIDPFASTRAAVDEAATSKKNGKAKR